MVYNIQYNTYIIIIINNVCADENIFTNTVFLTFRIGLSSIYLFFLFYTYDVILNWVSVIQTKKNPPPHVLSITCGFYKGYWWQCRSCKVHIYVYTTQYIDVIDYENKLIFSARRPSRRNNNNNNILTNIVCRVVLNTIKFDRLDERFINENTILIL